MHNFICESQEEFRSELLLVLEQAAIKRKLGFFENSKFENPNGGKSLTATWEIYDEFDQKSRAIIIAKFQKSSGTTEEKLLFEVVRCLEFFEHDSRFQKAWIILGGYGWNENFIHFIENRLFLWIPKMKGKVEIVCRRVHFEEIDFAKF